MTVARGLIVAAIILAIGAMVAAWLATPRYSMTNVGQGTSIRLDRNTGEMIGCQDLTCGTIDPNGKKVDADIPPPPPGYTVIRNR